MTDLAERGEDRDEGQRRPRPVAPGGMSGLPLRVAVLPAAAVAVLGIATVAFALQGGRSATTTTIVLIAAAVLTALVLIAAVRGAAGVTRRMRRELAARPGADPVAGPGANLRSRRGADLGSSPGADLSPSPGDRNQLPRPDGPDEAPQPTGQAAAALPDQRVEVLVNLARRMQSLGHRETQLLDELERQVEDPALLTRLFAVDHLATRLRRQAETLAVLGGAASRRQWNRPVPVHEVLRAAVAEVEHYARVTVVPPIEGALPGSAVTDVMHLMAELIENAAKFSAPHTKAEVRAELSPAGLAIEVEDHGLGMQAADLQRMNGLLADPVQADLAEVARDGRIGLFVAGMLARRHDITVQLQSTSDGGIQATVVLPATLLEPTPPPSALPARERLGAAPGPLDAAPGLLDAAPGPLDAAPEPRNAEPVPLDAGLSPQAAVLPAPTLLEATPAPTLPARRRQPATPAPRDAEPEPGDAGPARRNAGLAPRNARPAPGDPAPEPLEPGPRRARHRQEPTGPDTASPAAPAPRASRTPRTPGALPARRISRSAPPAAAPQDAAAQDAAPQDAAPQDAAPQDAAPQDAAPQDAAPQDAPPTARTAPTPGSAPVETEPPSTQPAPRPPAAERPVLPRRARQPRTALQPAESRAQPSDDPAADPPADPAAGVLAAFQRGVSQAAEEDR